MYQEQLCKEAAEAAASTASQRNVDEDMLELVSVTLPETDNAADSRYTKGSSNFERYIFDLDERDVQLGNALGSKYSGKNAWDGEHDKVERMALQLGSISGKDRCLYGLLIYLTQCRSNVIPFNVTKSENM